MHQQDNTFRVVGLISGRGSNLESLIKNARYYRVSAVVSDKPGAAGLAMAASHGVETKSFDRTASASVTAFKQAIFSHVAGLLPDLICLAGFMRVVPETVTRQFHGKMINIHPSLLPEFPGLDTHARVLAANHPDHGCSVHFVDGGVDTGPLIAQVKVKVQPGDTEQSLAKRVLESEHKLYPWVVNSIARGLIKLEGNRVLVENAAAEEARQAGFILP